MLVKGSLVTLISTLLWMGAMAQSKSVDGNGIPEDIQYLSPQPGSEYHMPQTRLVIRPVAGHDFRSMDAIAEEINILGNESGEHSFTLSLSRDKKTLNVIPDSNFELGEAVTVSYGQLFESETPSFSYSFGVTQVLHNPPAEHPEAIAANRNFPQLEYIITGNDGLYEGNIFMQLQSASEGDAVAIMPPDAQTPFPFCVEIDYQGQDFKLNRNGLPTLYNAVDDVFSMMGPDALEVRTFDMVNGYTVDSHDFQILPNGNYFLFAYDTQEYDMSQLVVGGQEDALVEGFVIQEFDYDDNLILQWRSWDFLSITDNEEWNLLSGNIPAFHINAIEIDTDEHIMISLRHTNEILKFHRQTGEIFWRWTINSYNDIEMVNDDGFSFQHDCRRLENGNILLFDNANLTTQISRAVEYSLDTTNMTATLVWQFIHPEELFGSSRGAARRLPNGNTIISWGNVAVDEYGERVSEVSPGQSSILLEFASPLGFVGYRATKAEWMFGSALYGACGDPNAINFVSDADFWLPDFCQYDNDGDGFSPEMGDCDDTNADINPDAEEIPNDGIDQNCDGLDLIDGDGDGVTVEDGDCNDDDSSIFPGAEEIPYDGIDQDCDGEDLTDVDQDGVDLADGDCNDEDDSIYPGAEEIPYDGIDQDCDGEDLDDLDEDGFGLADGDCNDEDDSIYPGAEEIPNDGIDQDCDGEDLIVSVDDINSPWLKVFATYNHSVVVQWPLNGSGNCIIYDETGRQILSQQLLSGRNELMLADYTGAVVVALQYQESVETRKLVVR